MNKQLAFLILPLLATSCGTIQGVTNKYASGIPGGRAALDAFRQAEGASQGMIPTNGRRVQTQAVDQQGNTLTNGVYLRVIVDETVVEPITSQPALIPPPKLPPQAPPTDVAPANPHGDALDAIGQLPTT